MIVVTEDNFEDMILKSKLPVLFYVFGHSCPPCKRIAPLIEQLAIQLQNRAVVAKLAVEDSPELAMKLGVSAVPTFIVFNDGAETNRMEGIQSRGKLLESLGQGTF